MMEKQRFVELKEDIKEHGQREKITLADGKILDGRNRYQACLELGIEPLTREYEGDPWSFVWSLNGQRRDLSEDQRAQIFIHVEAKSDRWRRERERIDQEANQRRSEAAQDGRVGRAAAKSGLVVVQSDPPLKQHKERAAKAVAAGVNASAIARAQSLANKRPDLAEKVRGGELKPAEARRLVKRDEVSQKAAALPEGQYAVIYADPPWEYNDKQGGELDQAYGGAEKHYPAMSLSDLKALDVPSLSADDCVLFLWATSPLLPEGLEVCRAWGFSYKACFIWDKVKHNMGRYNSVRHEFLLIATKGSGTPQVGKLFDSVQSVERTDKHSQKPEEFRTIIETLYPQGRKLEMFPPRRHAQRMGGVGQ